MDILAGTVSARVPVALVDVVRAIRPGEARCTRALVAVFERATLGPVSTGRRGAVILSFAMLACKPGAARAHVLAQRLEIACGTVEAGRGVASILDRDFAQTGGKTHGTGARERGSATPNAFTYPARTAVLAARSRVARIQVLTVFPYVFRCAIAMRLAARRRHA